MDLIYCAFQRELDTAGIEDATLGREHNVVRPTHIVSIKLDTRSICKATIHKPSIHKVIKPNLTTPKALGSLPNIAGGLDCLQIVTL